MKKRPTKSAIHATQRSMLDFCEPQLSFTGYELAFGISGKEIAVNIFYYFLTIFYGFQSSGSEVEIAVAPAFNACFISSSDRISPPAMIGVPVV